jgi:hypothetical protein
MTEEERSEAETLVMENLSRIDRDLYFEAVRGMSRGWKNKLFSLVGVLLAVAGLLMTWKILLILGLVLAAGPTLSSTIIGHRDYQKLLLRHPEGEWDKAIRFYEDRVETCAQGGEPTVVPYQDIRREVETEHLYILDFGKKAPSTMLRKDGFRTGSLDELKDFLLDRQRAAYNKDGTS